jgi:hypothetical protein
LCEAIQAEGQVPNPSALATDTTFANKGWVAMAAPYCSMASNAIQYVYPDRTETERRFYILRTIGGTPSLISPGSYQVPPTGWDTTVNWPDIQTSFLVLISSSKPDYLLACPVNGSATFSTWVSLAGSPAAILWAKNWVKQAVNGVYSATETQIVESSWTDKGQFLHVKVIPMNNLISYVSFGSEPTTAGSGMKIRDQAIVSFAPCYVTKGSTVYATDGGALSVTATATSSLLNLDFSSGTWRVNP